MTSDTTSGAAVPQTRHLQTSIPGPKSRALQEQRDAALPDGLGRTLPVFVDRMAGGIIVDVDGNRIVDLASGIAVTSVGASHPEVVRRVTEQAERFTHTCFLVTQYEAYVRVAEWLNAHTPGDFTKTTALFSTGAEAVENAVKIARAATGRPGVIVFSNAYHGRTLFTLAMTAKDKPYKTGFGPLPTEQVHRAPFPEPLRWPGAPAPERVVDEALRAFEDLVAEVGADEIACVVIEPIQGEGGFIVPPAGFLPRLADLARAHGIIVVGDEVQAGLGRTGTLFASEHDGFVPDIVCTAKALAGGMPLSAVTGRAEIMAAVGAGGLGGTYAGNPLACEAALGVFEVMDREDLPGRARAIEQQVRATLAPLVDPDRGIAELCGRGAMLAIEFVQPGRLEPAPEVAAAVAKACHEQGVLVLVCGTFGNVIRLLPPLVIEEDLLTDALQVLYDAIRAHADMAQPAGAPA